MMNDESELGRVNVADSASFWGLPEEFAALAAHIPPGGSEVLEKLGPPPFPRTGFPFVGFLATVYDHIAGHVAAGPSSGAGG
jgi:hypothetical protein